MRKLTITSESWPIAGRFAISRGSRTASEVVLVEVEEEGHVGRGECAPYPRYGESVESVMRNIEGLRGAIQGRLDRAWLQAMMPHGAARNALDCAFWDLAAKMGGQRAWQLAGLTKPGGVVTAYTLSLDTPEKMGEAAKANASRPLLKLKLTGPADLERVRAVHANAPKARLIVDANEAWTPEVYNDLAPKLGALGVELIEQPFHAENDAALADLARPVLVCADESCHDRASLKAIAGRYDAVNIKLDKTGGLTEALALKAEAKAAGFRIMIGCMLGTSLAMAPAMLLAEGAAFVDLDGPLILAKDRSPGLQFSGSVIAPAEPALWG